MSGPSLDLLKQCLSDARVPQELIDYAVGALGLQSVDDFVNLVTQAGYENELNTVLVEPCAATRGNALALSRVRAAWRAARAQVLKAELKKSQGLPSEDLDEPLEPSTQDSLLQQWRKKYALELTVHLQPSDSLLGRLYREHIRGTPTLIPVAKIRSLAFCNRAHSQERRINLSGQVSIQVDREFGDMPISSIFAYYQGLRILANGLSVVDSNLVDSKAKPGEKCVAAPLHVDLTHADTAFKCTADQNASVEWTRARDEATRARAVELQREGWPQGEALQSAWQSQEIYLQAEREEPFQDVTVPSGDIRPSPQPACKPCQVTSQYAVIPRSKAALNRMIWRQQAGRQQDNPHAIPGCNQSCALQGFASRSLSGDESSTS